MIRKKVLIMIMSSSNPVYKSLEDSIKQTWYNLKSEDVEIIFYSDNNLESEKLDFSIIRENNLILPCDDGYYMCGVKTLLAFEWILNNYEFDYIYRSNLGSFVFPDRILNFLRDKPKSNFYCGILGIDTFNLRREVKFASGSGYFLSQDLVRLIIQKKSDFIFNCVDDVAVGELLYKNGCEVNLSASRWSLCDGDSYFQIGDQNVDDISIDDIYHIRLRSVDRNLDISNMKKIYKNIQSKEELKKIMIQKKIKLHYGGNDHYFTEEEILSPLNHYNVLCNISSDINEHLPIIKKYAEECATVVEMGVRFACSTWAFIEAKPKKLTCVDINYDYFQPSESFVKKACENYGIDFKWITGDSLKLEIEQTDLLMIDTLHTYLQLKKELEKHHSRVNKYIILHDTISFAYRNESIYQHASDEVKDQYQEFEGLMQAVYQFLETHKEWDIKEVFTNNNGLTILERKN